MSGGEVEESKLLRRSIGLQCFVCPTLCVVCVCVCVFGVCVFGVFVCGVCARADTM